MSATVFTVFPPVLPQARIFISVTGSDKSFVSPRVGGGDSEVRSWYPTPAERVRIRRSWYLSSVRIGKSWYISPALRVMIESSEVVVSYTEEFTVTAPDRVGLGGFVPSLPEPHPRGIRCCHRNAAFLHRVPVVCSAVWRRRVRSIRLSWGAGGKGRG